MRGRVGDDIGRWTEWRLCVCGREGGREGREGGREGERERGKEGREGKRGREGGREEGRREGGREGERKGERERGRERMYIKAAYTERLLPPLTWVRMAEHWSLGSLESYCLSRESW